MCSISYMNKIFVNWTTISGIFSQFSTVHAQKWPHTVTTSGQIFNPQFEILMGCFLFEYEFWWHFRRDLYVFCAKNCFCNAKFSECGEFKGWVKIFWRTPKRHILARFHVFWAIDHANPFTGFCSRPVHEKSDTTKSHRGYVSPIHAWEIPTQLSSTKICVRVGVADVINHTKFDSDRSREYKVMEGRILPCSIGMACRL